jgi:hypothetical protein
VFNWLRRRTESEKAEAEALPTELNLAPGQTPVVPGRAGARRLTETRCMETSPALICPDCQAALPVERSETPWCECGWTT